MKSEVTRLLAEDRRPKKGKGAKEEKGAVQRAQLPSHTAMAPPPTPAITAQAVSGITGSISIACWIIVFAPQIYQNFARRSAEGLSLLFVVLWLAGDVFNVIGAILQGVLPTMTILAIYYTLADIVLLWQCLYYGHGATSLAALKEVDPIHLSPANPLNGESEPLLISVLSNENPHHHHHHEVDPNAAHEVIIQADSHGNDTAAEVDTEGQGSPAYSYNDINGSNPHDVSCSRSNSSSSSCSSSSSIQGSDLSYNLIMVSLVIIAGFGGWYFGDHSTPESPPSDDDLIFHPLAQFFGWLCAVLYLGSRIPQILLNFERKSCDGISFLFFLFACLGNITYVVSILAVCTGKKYLLVNSSWLVGSFGTLVEDFIIFCQFFAYNKGNSTDEEAYSDDDGYDSEAV